MTQFGSTCIMVNYTQQFLYHTYDLHYGGEAAVSSSFSWTAAVLQLWTECQPFSEPGYKLINKL